MHRQVAGDVLEQGLHVICRRRRRFLVVGHAQTAAQIQMVNLDTQMLQLFQQLEYPLQGIFEGRQLGELAADVAVDAQYLDVWQLGGALIECRCLGDIHAELVVLQAGGDVGVGLGVHIRVHADGDGRFTIQFAGDQIEQFQLGGGFHVKAMDVGFQGGGHFIGGLADAGKHDLVRIAAGAQYPFQFAAGDDIKAGAATGQHVQYRQVGVGFHRITDLVRMIAEGLVEGLEVTFQGGTGIEVQRRAETVGQLFYRQFFGEQLAVAVLEVIHDYSCSSSSWSDAAGWSALSSCASTGSAAGS